MKEADSANTAHLWVVSILLYRKKKEDTNRVIPLSKRKNHQTKHIRYCLIVHYSTMADVAADTAQKVPSPIYLWTTVNYWWMQFDIAWDGSEGTCTEILPVYQHLRN